MDIEIYQGHAPQMPAAGLTVVIDVLRAFTTTHVAFARGIERILLAETVEEAFALKKKHPQALLAGERDARKVEGFDMGNSPADLAAMDAAELNGRRMILTTSNGTRATLHALESSARTLVAGWTSAPATIAWLRDFVGAGPEDGQRVYRRVHLLASHPHSDEDVACAEYMRDRLRAERGDDQPMTAEETVSRMRSSSSAQKFFSEEWRRADIDLACGEPFGDFVMAVEEVATEGRDALPTVSREPAAP